MADDPAIDAARQRARRIANRQQVLDERRDNLDKLQQRRTEVLAAIAARQEDVARFDVQIAQTDAAVAQALARLLAALDNQPDPP